MRAAVTHRRLASMLFVAAAARELPAAKARAWRGSKHRRRKATKARMARSGNASQRLPTAANAHHVAHGRRPVSLPVAAGHRELKQSAASKTGLTHVAADRQEITLPGTGTQPHGQARGQPHGHAQGYRQRNGRGGDSVGQRHDLVAAFHNWAQEQSEGAGTKPATRPHRKPETMREQRPTQSCVQGPAQTYVR